MSTGTGNDKLMDEQQSLMIIRQMIELSRKRIHEDGILFIIWGWIAFTNYFLLAFLIPRLKLPAQIQHYTRPLSTALLLGGLAYTAYYLYRQNKKYQSYIGISIRYIWISLIGCMVLVNLIQFNVLNLINYELQHPIFMVFIAFAIIITGGLIRYKLIIYGGVAFALLAYLASCFPLQQQLLVEAIAWLLAFIIPGHILYYRKQKEYV